MTISTTSGWLLDSISGFRTHLQQLGRGELTLNLGRLRTDLAGQLARDPEFADKIHEPIEVVGVEGLAGSGVKLKARIKAMPIEQWKVGWKYNRRIKMAFDDAGIQMRYPHLKPVLPQGAPA